MIRALVLAAGESRRMGVPKPLLRFDDTSFLGQIISILESSRVDAITVVLGAQAETIRTSVDLTGAEVVVNAGYQQGQLSSLVAGLKSLPSEVDAILLCLVDQPFITAETIERIIAVFRETGKPVVIPTFDGRRGHPALFARSVFDELISAPAEKGARHVVHVDPARVLEVEVADPDILTKIDTPQEYRSHFGTEPQAIARKP